MDWARYGSQERQLGLALPLLFCALGVGPGFEAFIDLINVINLNFDWVKFDYGNWISVIKQAASLGD